MNNIRVFLSEIFQFLEVNFSIYLNRLVFVMRCKTKRHILGLLFAQACLSKYWYVPYRPFCTTWLIVSIFCLSKLAINKNSLKGYVVPARERGWRKFTKSVNREI